MGSSRHDKESWVGRAFSGVTTRRAASRISFILLLSHDEAPEAHTFGGFASFAH
jgi:hypothetical protein